MASRFIEITNETRVILGKEAVGFAAQPNIWRKNRLKTEIVKNRFAGNCRSYIYSQVEGCEL